MAALDNKSGCYRFQGLQREDMAFTISFFIFFYSYLMPCWLMSLDSLFGEL